MTSRLSGLSSDTCSCCLFASAFSILLSFELAEAASFFAFARATAAAIAAFLGSTAVAFDSLVSDSVFSAVDSDCSALPCAASFFAFARATAAAIAAFLGSAALVFDSLVSNSPASDLALSIVDSDCSALPCAASFFAFARATAAAIAAFLGSATLASDSLVSDSLTSDSALSTVDSNCSVPLCAANFLAFARATAAAIAAFLGSAACFDSLHLIQCYLQSILIVCCYLVLLAFSLLHAQRRLR